MPALNFKKEFAPMVESGEKRTTIRALRKDGRNPRPGQTLYLYMGMRTKGCRKLGEAICKSVAQLSIEENLDVYIGVNYLPLFKIIDLAKKDGFNNVSNFYQFFKKTHGLPFYGLLIKW